MTVNDTMALARLRADVLSGRVRQIRVRAHLSQVEVAKAIRTSASAVSQWEAARRMPRGRPALRYAALLDELDQAARETP